MRYNGKVIWFKKHLGYGFIKVDGEEWPNAFFHHSSLKMDGFRDIKRNTPVSFEVHFSRLGVTATEVSIK